jgi:hypothetical protein
LVGELFQMSERPFTQKSSFGQESVNNTIFWFNTNFSSEVPFLTRLVKVAKRRYWCAVKPIRKGEVAFKTRFTKSRSVWRRVYYLCRWFWRVSNHNRHAFIILLSLSSTRIEIREVDTISMLMQMI